MPVASGRKIRSKLHLVLQITDFRSIEVPNSKQPERVTIRRQRAIMTSIKLHLSSDKLEARWRSWH
jgi:hypothetical protein